MLIAGKRQIKWDSRAKRGTSLEKMKLLFLKSQEFDHSHEISIEKDRINKIEKN